MQISIYSATNHHKESCVFLKIQVDAAFQFDKIHVELIPHNLRYNRSGFGSSISSLRTETDIELDSSLIREMQALQLKNPAEFIAEFYFKLQIEAFNGRKKLPDSACWIKVQSPWKNAAEATRYPHGKKLYAQEISKQKLPLPALQMVLKNDFDAENLLAAYAATNVLDVQLIAHENIQNIHISCELKGQKIASANIAHLSAGQEYPLQLQLLENIAHLFNIAQQNDLQPDTAYYTLDLVADCDADGQQKQSVSTLWLKNPVANELAQVQRNVAKQIQMLLNQHFANTRHNIEEHDNWCFFQIGEHRFQYGIKDGALYACTGFKRIAYNANFKSLKSEMSILNKSLKHKIKEINSHFVVEAKLKVDKLKDQNVVKFLNELLLVADNPSVRDFMRAYEAN